MSIFDNGRAAGAAAAGLVAVSLVLSACSGGGGAPDAGSQPSKLAAPDESQPVTINVDSFGGIFANFEKAGLLDDYKKLHPNVTVKYTEVQQESDYWTALTTKLNSGIGAGGHPGPRDQPGGPGHPAAGGQVAGHPHHRRG